LELRRSDPLEDLKIGDRLVETIDMAIRLRDKLLLILSETSKHGRR
jgi:hypothetical protein